MLCAGRLSGGNQQKLIIAREFERKPRLFIAAQPTRGVDVGAIELIHRRLFRARDEGAGMLLVSSELDEIFTLSDRILVMYGGRIVARFKRGEADELRLGLAMCGSEAVGVSRAPGGPAWSGARVLGWLRPVLAVAGGLAVGLLVTRLAGESPWHVLQILARSSFGTLYDFGMTLFYATPLMLTGLSVAVAFHAGLFNIGAEGQLTLGALAVAAVGGLLPRVPAPLATVLATLAAVLAGGLWGAIPGWLRAGGGA